MIKLELPQPESAALDHSAQLKHIIRNTIAAKSGWIDFSEYMQLALYTPSLGYYSGCLQKFGEHGDFITAPEVSPLFGQCLANPLAQIIKSMPAPHIIEFGAGSGKLAAEVLAQLALLKALPEQYLIVELSAELQQRQSQTIMQRVPQLHPLVVWLQSLPENPVNAVVLANEVLDAMPVTRFIKQQGKFFPLGVACNGDNLSLALGEFNAELNQHVTAIENTLDHEFCDGYVSEINLNISPWVKSVSAVLNQGAVFLLDYGYARSEYYLPERSMGTLMCYFRHRAFDDPLHLPGLQDITAFIDFTALAEAAQSAQLDVQGFTSQAHFLMDCGLPQLLEQKLGDDQRQNLMWIQQMKTLTLPSEMGERFKVMLLNKNIDVDIPGFGLQDMRYRL